MGCITSEFGHITSVKQFVSIVSENREVGKQLLTHLHRLSINLRAIIGESSYDNHVHFFQKYTMNTEPTAYNFIIFLKMMNEYKKVA